MNTTRAKAWARHIADPVILAYRYGGALTALRKAWRITASGWAWHQLKLAYKMSTQ